MKKTVFLVAALLSVFTCFAQVVDFEDLTLEENSSWTGADGSGVFTSSYLSLYNDYDQTYGSWQGFAYTNTTDTETYYYTNISATAGHGYDNSENYVIGFVGTDWMNGYTPIPTSMSINTSESGSFENRGAYFCLPVYTSKYIDADSFYATNGFYYKLLLSAYADGNFVAEREVLMADFTDGNSYKMTDWTYVDLSWIETADSLTVIALCNDSGEWGINTPTYFCMDNFGANAPTSSIESSITEQVRLNAFIDEMGNVNLNSDCKILNVEVYDVAGRLLKTLVSNENNLSLTLNNSGMLIISATTENGRAVTKLVK